MPFKTPLGERAGNQVAPSFIRPLQDKRCIIGQRILLECQIEGHPDPVIKWLKDGLVYHKKPQARAIFILTARRHATKSPFQAHGHTMPRLRGMDSVLLLLSSCKLASHYSTFPPI